MQNSVGSDPGISNPPIPFVDSPFIVPPIAQPSKQSVKRDVRSGVVILVAIIAVLSGGSGVYVSYVLPRQNAVRIVDQMKPYMTLLKAATSEVMDEIDSMYKLVTKQNEVPVKSNMQTNGLLIHSDIANLAASGRVLGESITTGQKAIIEDEFSQIAKLLFGSMRILRGVNAQVAGASTSVEDPYLQMYRTLKDETVKTSESVGKGQAALAQLVTVSQSMPMMISSDAKAKVGANTTLKITADGYFSEAKKIADYYQILSDVVISMNTKINSFNSAISSAGAGFGTVLQSGDSNTAKTILAQTQVFLDQANKDMQDMKKLTEKLSTVSNEYLPMASADYHAHNLQVLQVATTYCASQSGIIQGLVTATSTIVAKGDQNALTVGDMTAFQNQVTSGVNQSALFDAKFASDLQTLQGEEGTLAISFWQNNSRLFDGSKVKDAVNTYQVSLEKLREVSKIPGLVQ